MNALAQNIAKPATGAMKVASASSSGTTADSTQTAKGNGDAFSKLLVKALEGGQDQSAAKTGPRTEDNENNQQQPNIGDLSAVLMTLIDPQLLQKLMTAPDAKSLSGLSQTVVKLVSQLTQTDQQVLLGGDQTKALVAAVENLLKENRVQPTNVMPAAAIKPAVSGQADMLQTPVTLKQFQNVIGQLLEQSNAVPRSDEWNKAAASISTQLASLAKEAVVMMVREQAGNQGATLTPQKLEKVDQDVLSSFLTAASANSQSKGKTHSSPDNKGVSSTGLFMKAGEEHNAKALSGVWQAGGQQTAKAAGEAKQTAVQPTNGSIALMMKHALPSRQWTMQAVQPSMEQPSSDTGTAVKAAADPSQALTLQIPPLQPRVVDALPKQVPILMQAQNFAEDFSQFMLKSIKINEVSGISEAKISLVPEHLGKLDVQLTMHNGQLVAQFFAENAHAKDLLEGQMQQLRTVLQNQGIQVDKLQVSQQSGMHSQMFQEQNRQSSSQQHGGQGKRKAAYIASDFSDKLTAQEEESQHYMLYGNSFNVTA